MSHPAQQRRPPTKPATTRARAETAAHTRFTCPGCGLNFPRRRSADAIPPHRCLCCAFLLTIADTKAREGVRRVLARAGLQQRFGGRDAPPPVARGVLRLLP